VVVYSFGRFLENRIRSVKRRWALVETNPPGNSWPQTHRIDEPRGEAEFSFAPGFHKYIEPIDLLMP